MPSLWGFRVAGNYDTDQSCQVFLISYILICKIYSTTQYRTWQSCWRVSLAEMWDILFWGKGWTGHPGYSECTRAWFNPRILGPRSLHIQYMTLFSPWTRGHGLRCVFQIRIIVQLKKLVEPCEPVAVGGLAKPLAAQWRLERLGAGSSSTDPALLCTSSSLLDWSSLTAEWHKAMAISQRSGEHTSQVTGWRNAQGLFTQTNVRTGDSKFTVKLTTFYSISNRFRIL